MEEINPRLKILCDLVGLDSEDLTERYEDEFVLNKRTSTVGYSPEEAIDLVEELRQYLRAAFMKGKLPIGVHSPPDHWIIKDILDMQGPNADPPFRDINQCIIQTIKDLYPITITNFSVNQLLTAWDSIVNSGYHDSISKNIVQAFDNNPDILDTKRVLTEHDGVYHVIDDNQAYDVAHEKAYDYFRDKIYDDIPEEYEYFVDYEGYVNSCLEDLDIGEWLGIEGEAYVTDRPIDGCYWWAIKIE